jgi:hypothetical protein
MSKAKPNKYFVIHLIGTSLPAVAAVSKPNENELSAAATVLRASKMPPPRWGIAIKWVEADEFIKA